MITKLPTSRRKSSSTTNVCTLVGAHVRDIQVIQVGKNEWNYFILHRTKAKLHLFKVSELAAYVFLVKFENKVDEETMRKGGKTRAKQKRYLLRNDNFEFPTLDWSRVSQYFPPSYHCILYLTCSCSTAFRWWETLLFTCTGNLQMS